LKFLSHSEGHVGGRNDYCRSRATICSLHYLEICWNDIPDCLKSHHSQVTNHRQMPLLANHTVETYAKSRLPSFRSFSATSLRGFLPSNAWPALSLRLIFVMSYFVPPILGPCSLL
jgi:hypothetical protein